MKLIDIFQIIFASIAGGTIVTLATYLAERLGSKVGGVIGGFPSTLLVSALFLIYSKDPEFASNAMGYIPASLGVYGLALLSYYFFSKNSFLVGAIGSFLLWLSGVLIVRANLPLSSTFSIVLFLICFVIARGAIHFIGGVDFFSGKKVKYNSKQLFIRASFSGLVVGLCVFISKISGPEMSGLFAAFPVATYSSFTIAYYVRGLSFARSLALPFIVAGMWNSFMFSVIVHFTLVPLGTTFSILLGLLGSLISAYVCLKHLGKAEKRAVLLNS